MWIIKKKIKNKYMYGDQETIRVTQFSAMGGPVGDPWIWAYP